MITVCALERQAIAAYLTNTKQYVDQIYWDQSFLLSSSLPNGTKVTRIKNGQHRQLLVPTDGMGHMLRIDIIHAHYSDIEFEKQHSCTFYEGKYYYHQNKFENPASLEHAQEVLVLDAEDNEELVTFREGLSPEGFAKWYQLLMGQRLYALSKKNYIKKTKEPFLVSTVKRAVDDGGHLFYLKSNVSPSEQIIRYAQPIVSHLGAFTLFRTWSDEEQTIYRKKVTFTPDVGDSLYAYLEQGLLSLADKEHLAHGILSSYLTEVYEKNRVHTDINPSNICIQRVHAEWVVEWIDWDESFLIDHPAPTGKGTPGFLAPEFFKSQEAFDHQLVFRAESEDCFFAALKGDFRHEFTQSSDLYALGRTLDTLCLPQDSVYAVFAHALCAYDPGNRPDGAEIQDFLMTVISDAAAGTDVSLQAKNKYTLTL